MKKKLTLWMVILSLFSFMNACSFLDSGDCDFKLTENEPFSLQSLNFKGDIANVVVTSYESGDPNVKTRVSTFVFNSSGYVTEQREEDLVNGECCYMKFSYNKDGSIKSLKTQMNDGDVDLNYTYDKKNRTRECRASANGQEVVNEMVWYDQNGYPSKIISNTNPDKYWAYNYDATGKMLSKSSYLNDGSGTMLLNYIHSEFVGDKWTKEIAQDDAGNSYLTVTCRYNEHEDLVEESSQTQVPGTGTSVKSKIKINYVYDNTGNWTEMTQTSTINNEKPFVIRRTQNITYR